MNKPEQNYVEGPEDLGQHEMLYDDDDNSQYEDFNELFEKKEESLNIIQKFLQRLKAGVFGVLYIMAKDTRLSRHLLFFLLYFDFVQLMIFPFSAKTEFPWNRTYMNWIIVVLSVFDFTT